MTVNITEYQNYFQPLQSRMDASMNLRNLKEYAVLTDDKGKMLPNSKQIILNYPRVFSDAVVAALGEDTPNWEITGVDAVVQHELEELIKFWIPNNDEILSRQLIEPFDACQNFFITNRGWGAALPIVEYDPSNKKYLIRFTPQDARWKMWKVGSRGFEWTLTWIRSNKEETLRRYSKYMKANNVDFKTKGNDIILATVWTTKEYQVFEVGTDLSSLNLDYPLFSKEHRLGFCPEVVTPTPLSPELISTPDGYANDLSEQGPDVFAPIMQMIKYMNEFASIWASINRSQFDTPLQLQADKDVNTENIDMKDTVLTGYGIKTVLPAGTRLIEIPTKDMAASAQNLFQVFFNGFEMGAFTTAAFGEAGNREPALVYAERRTTTGKVVNPRRKCKSTLYRSCIGNITRQFREKKFYITDIDDDCAVDKPDFSLFEKKFMVNLSFSSISPQENIVNAQLAAQLHRDLKIPLVDVYRDILHDPDPEGKARASAKEALEMQMPAVTFAKGILSYLPVKDATQEEIDSIIADVAMGEYWKYLEGQSNTESPPNPASQAKIEGIPNSNKLSSMQERRTGQAQLRKAIASRTGGND